MSSSGLGLGRPSSFGRDRPTQNARIASRGNKAPRMASGGAFQMFTPPQIKQFREAFTLIDADGDGKITEDDLIATFGNLGQTPSQKVLDSLLTQPGGSTTARTINFTQFLTLFGQHLLELADSEQEILDAFACFDEHDLGYVNVGRSSAGERAGAEGAEGTIGQDGLRGWLRDYGDRMSEDELDRFFKGPFTDKQGRLDYVKFAKTLKVNDADEVESQHRRQE
ncbi:hypothetical protein NliqN6_6275 [Naganishia liquefaciens]|uniref:EF-hand domain-containing protein n=1 Tax=Naganishia liquefaciens TaxID=104408 RepID=A0A8H3YHZ8_9TREE|nr:hypothetical protein NliqN6_6275 [Naganishia liquefaciens]